MVIDYVYQEYGLDRDAIKSSIKKVNIHEDKDFEDVISRIDSCQNSSFLN